MLEQLVSEQSHAASRSIDELPTAEILNIMNAADAEVPAAVAREIPRIARAVETIAASLEQGGHLIYIGAGTSGRLGVLDASECPPTFNVAKDLVRGIIAGGERALVRSTEASEDDPEAGARDLLAGTATKLVLNMISTGVMIRLGHVYGNLMVNVRPTNRKLEDRARRIIQQATGVSYERAAELLEEGDRSVRNAIVMEKKKVSH